MDDLEKIDLIRERLGVSYREAREALLAAGGDVVEALVRLEGRDDPWKERLQRSSRRLAGEFRGWVEKAGESSIRISKEGRTVAEMPAAVGMLGLLGALASPPLAVMAGAGAVAGWLNDYRMEVRRPEEDGTGE